MAENAYSYIIVGGGLAGASAIEGIRDLDKKGSILLIGSERDEPYDRPPVSKQLWTGGKKVEEIFVHPREFYSQNGTEVKLGVDVTELDLRGHVVRERGGGAFRYQKLLVATGGSPRRLGIPGGDAKGISYYRTLEGYRSLRAAATKGKSALVIGGGFIGSEMAASLTANQVSVTMVFPGKWLVSRVFPEGLGVVLTDYYRQKGVQVVTDDSAVSIDAKGSGYLTRTRGGREIPTDLIVVGIGITPNVALAKGAGLKTGDGVLVDQFLRTSDPDVSAAGDVAFFPEAVLGSRRIEHWDNAVSQGKHAGRNMAGANEPFTQLPFFFSDLFEFGYEAVGDVDSRHETFADWQEPNKTGVIYYLGEGRVRGAMMCNVWNKVDAARDLIRKGEPMGPNQLRGAIR